MGRTTATATSMVCNTRCLPEWRSIAEKMPPAAKIVTATSAASAIGNDGISRIITVPIARAKNIDTARPCIWRGKVEWPVEPQSGRVRAQPRHLLGQKPVRGTAILLTARRTACPGIRHQRQRRRSASRHRAVMISAKG